MIRLTGIPAASPIGFMAALGLLRVLGQDHGVPVSLGWQDGCACLEGIDAQELVDVLVRHMEGRHQAREFTWSDSTRGVTADAYRAACLDAARANDLRALGFLAAYGSDAVLDDKGQVRSTRLDMTSGRQSLISDLRKLAAVLESPDAARAAFQAALFGGAYDKDQSSYGLDPATQRSHATEHASPQKSAPLGKRGWVWLFAESLPLHPVLPVGSNRALPAGYDLGYFWPIWHAQVSLAEASALRLLSLDALRRLAGIDELWRSTYFQIGKYGALSSPRREPLVT